MMINILVAWGCAGPAELDGSGLAADAKNAEYRFVFRNTPENGYTGGPTYEETVSIPRQATVSAIEVSVRRQVRFTVSTECQYSTAGDCMQVAGGYLDYVGGGEYEVLPHNVSGVYFDLDGIDAWGPITSEDNLDAFLGQVDAEHTLRDAQPAIAEAVGPFDGTLDHEGPSSAYGESNTGLYESWLITDPAVLAQFEGFGSQDVHLGAVYWGSAGGTCPTASSAVYAPASWTVVLHD